MIFGLFNSQPDRNSAKSQQGDDDVDWDDLLELDDINLDDDSDLDLDDSDDDLIDVDFEEIL